MCKLVQSHSISKKDRDPDSLICQIAPEFMPPKNFRNTELRRSTNKGQIVTSRITPTMRKSKRTRVRTGTHWRLAPAKMLLFPDVRRVNRARGPSTCRVKNVPFFATYWVEYTQFLNSTQFSWLHLAIACLWYFLSVFIYLFCAHAIYFHSHFANVASGAVYFRRGFFGGETINLFLDTLSTK